MGVFMCGDGHLNWSAPSGSGDGGNIDIIRSSDYNNSTN